MRLTQTLGGVTEPLSDEASIALRNIWTDVEEWHDLTLKPCVLRIIVQLSSRVLLGDKVCRDPAWLKVMVNYTLDAVVASEAIRLWPPFLRSIVAPFLESYRKIKSELDEARNIIKPILEERRREKETALKSGKPIPYNNDAMEWMEQTAKGRAVRSSGDAANALCRCYPYNVGHDHSVALRRVAEQNIKLSDGTEIALGNLGPIPNDWMWDEKFYENANTFDPYRFLKKPQTPGQGSHAQLGTPSAEHLRWGRGKHPCPGRFFAANEMKIFLYHALLKYDFKLADGSVPQLRRQGFALHADTSARISIRRRHEEIVLEDLTD